MTFRKRIPLVLLAFLLVGGGMYARSAARERERVRRTQQEFLSAQIKAFHHYGEEEDLFRRYLDTLTPAQLLDALEARYPYCHAEAHYLGREILNRSKSIYDAIEACGARCGSGCYHGVVIQALKNREEEAKRMVLGKLSDAESLTNLTKEINGWCDNPITASIHPRKGGCLHSAGHAFLIYDDYDIGEGLTMCHGFGDKTARYYCAHGVFMEYFDELRNKESKIRDYPKRDLRYPCDKYPEFPSACYRYKMQQLLIDRPLSQSFRDWLRGAVAECSSMSGFARLGCFHGVGFASIVEIARAPSILKEACSWGNENDNVICIEGAVELFSERDEEKTQEACASLLGNLKAACVAAAERHMFSMDRNFDLYFR